MYIYLYICMFVYICIWVCVFIYIYVYICIHICINIYVYIYIYTYIHMHIYLCTSIYDTGLRVAGNRKHDSQNLVLVEQMILSDLGFGKRFPLYPPYHPCWTIRIECVSLVKWTGVQPVALSLRVIVFAPFQIWHFKTIFELLHHRIPFLCFSVMIGA